MAVTHEVAPLAEAVLRKVHIAAARVGSCMSRLHILTGCFCFQL